MLLVAPPFFRVASGFVAPSRTMVTKNFSSVLWIGYVRSGGFYAGLLGDSGGTLSGTILTGFTTDAIFQQQDADWNLGAAFAGNAIAALAGCTGIKVNTTVFPVRNAAQYDGDYDVTALDFDGSALHLAASTSYTVQLV